MRSTNNGTPKTSVSGTGAATVLYGQSDYFDNEIQWKVSYNVHIELSMLVEHIFRLFFILSARISISK